MLLNEAVQQDEKIATTHLLDLQLGFAALTIVPRIRDHSVAIPAHDRFQRQLQGQVEVR